MNEYQQMVKDAQEKRLKLTNEQLYNIKSMYNDIWRDLVARCRTAKSGSMSERWLRDYRSQFREDVKLLNDILNKQLTGNIEKSASYATDIQKKMFEKFNLDPTFTNMFTKIPKEVLAELVNGDFYKDGKGLSKRIWWNEKKANADFDYIIQKGLTEKRSVYDIASDLAKYVNPNAKMDMDLKKIYPGVGNKKIEYNSFRLAVTSISHAYQLGMKRSCGKNPFVEGIEWHVGNSHRNTCGVCRDRDGMIYKPNDLPLDHPNGICYFTPVIEKSLDDIGSELRNWIDGEPNEKLDKWYKDNGGKEEIKEPPKTIGKKELIKRQAKEAAAKKETNLTGMQEAFKAKRLGKVWPTVEKMILDSPDFIQQWYSKYGDKLQFDNTSSKSAYYHPSTGKITMHVRNDATGTRGPHSTFFHEFGHLLDAVCRVWVDADGNRSDVFEGEKTIKLSADKRFVNAIQEDYQDRLNSPLLKDKPKPFVKGKLTEMLYKLGDLSSGVQDMYSGLTLNEVRPGWGHSTEYWKRGDTSLEIASEAFAHMSSSYTNPERLKIMKEWFPKACEVFETIVKEVID